MHVKQAIEQQVDIICGDINERNKCVEILEREEVKRVQHYREEGLFIALGRSGIYCINGDPVGCTPKIPAADFIASNTIPEASALYTPAEIEYMDKVAIAAVQGSCVDRHLHRTPSNDIADDAYNIALAMLEQKRLLISKSK